MESQATPVSIPPAPASKKFLFVSHDGLIHDLAWEVKKEGAEVRYYIHSKGDKDVADGFVDKVDSVCKIGDILQVKVIAIDDQDRVKLSRKAILREQQGKPPSGPGDAPPRRQDQPPRRRDGGGEGDGGRR